jgi:oxygen-independent coproporphyrinogen III oxidase
MHPSSPARVGILNRVRRFAHLYLHIPFCRHKCGYCDFNAYSGMDRLMPEYVDALIRELEEARRRLRFGPLRTIYLGGGTPSLLPAPLMGSLLARIRGLFDVEPDAEVTLEANPASTDETQLACWRAGGVNRLSLGVQGFDPRALAVLERRTDGAQAQRAYRQARAAGFANISLDLIYAVPHQSLASWEDTVRRAIALRPDHFSCYGLSFETGTLLHRRRARGLLPEVASDAQWDQLDAADRLLAAAGYRRYEVSSWALPRRRSRHNHAYWACRPVYGAGAGAHSYGAGAGGARRWWNVARPRDYIAASPHVEEDGEDLGRRLAAAERMMLGLRTVRGLRPPPGFERELADLERAGLIRRRGVWAAPTRRGLDLHNQIALAVL